MTKEKKNFPESEDTVSVSIGSGGGEYYVYALSRRPVEEGFDPGNIFYVGKGKGTRWQQHFADTLADLRRREADPSVELSRKKQTISELFAGDDGLDIERYAYLVEWNLTEAEAFRTEALVIKMMNSYGNDLTNEVAGHREAEVLMPAGEVRRYYAAEKLEVPRVRAGELEDFLPGGDREDEGVCVVVKGSTVEMEYCPDVIDSDADDGGFAAASVGDAFSGQVRSGWDPRAPWSDPDARERARHYWTVGVGTAECLKEIADDGRLQLALAIRDPRAGQTVIRYLWEVSDAESPWLWYTDAGQVGFPLGRSFTEAEDPWLGKCLVREDDGKQLLEALATGIGFAAYSTSD